MSLWLEPAVFPVLLDSCVLYPYELRDLLLEISHEHLYRVHWSPQILEDTVRNLLADARTTPEQVNRFCAAMKRAFPEALPPEPRYLPNEPELMAPGAGTDDRALMAPAAGTDGPVMLAALVTALQQAQPPAPQMPPDPLAVARALGDAAALGAWLTTAEVVQLLRVSPGTVRSWGDGHQPWPGFRLDRRRDGSAVWWRVTAVTG